MSERGLHGVRDGGAARDRYLPRMNNHSFIVSAIHSIVVDCFLASGITVHLGHWRCSVRNADKGNVALESSIKFIGVY